MTATDRAFANLLRAAQPKPEPSKTAKIIGGTFATLILTAAASLLFWAVAAVGVGISHTLGIA